MDLVKGCIVAVALAIAGCDGVSRDQLLVRPSAVEPGASREIAAHIRVALSVVASRHGFVDRTPESQSNGVMAWFVQPVDNFPIEFGARRVDRGIIIDLHHFRPGAKATERYRRIRAELTTALESIPGASVTVLPDADH